MQWLRSGELFSACYPRAPVGPEYGRHMTTEYYTTSDKVRIGAVTALKFGFFAAFGVFLFYVILSVVLGTAALLLGAAGLFDITNLLPG
jgi:hypothetical protein